MQGIVEQRLEACADILNGNATGPARRPVDADHNRPVHCLGEPLGVRTGSAIAAESNCDAASGSSDGTTVRR
jgi:hypothetical protein